MPAKPDPRSEAEQRVSRRVVRSAYRRMAGCSAGRNSAIERDRHYHAARFSGRYGLGLAAHIYRSGWKALIEILVGQAPWPAGDPPVALRPKRDEGVPRRPGGLPHKDRQSKT